MKKRKNLQLKKDIPLDQCALYKIRSKRRLCQILNIPISSLKGFMNDDRNYHTVDIEEFFNELTGKRKKARTASVPNYWLKKLHSRVHRLLSSIAAPLYAHGSIKSRSYITNALVHVGSKEVLTMDLRDFFRSVKRHHVYFFFKDKLCCSPDVAGVLSNLLTYQGALPVGSPASAIIAMWACHTMFERLNQLASEYRLKFSVFVDDLTFSGEVVPGGYQSLVERICAQSGLSVREDKTVLYKHGTAASVTGVIIYAGAIKPPHSRYQNLRKLSAILSQQGAHAIVNGKHAKYSFQGGRNETMLLRNISIPHVD
ncbi:reverse transcriptase family protein [Pseudomonas syringae pv. syringae]|uniref:reverse transcriptase family protein n=1 Tax=Pseudomonas syringae TaxID=317 RepID=UPI00200AA956|nr:reverse transcriptase family protein [Pseudomonas syringae]MCK9719404.1 reverse transcriptase family protein [Pseudomonas syringae pv. syringae]MCK9764797.1 reverse transcriptase family protein [Pseudomonas syringae pv. syringae]